MYDWICSLIRLWYYSPPVRPLTRGPRKRIWQTRTEKTQYYSWSRRALFTQQQISPPALFNTNIPNAVTSYLDQCPHVQSHKTARFIPARGFKLIRRRQLAGSTQKPHCFFLNFNVMCFYFKTMRRKENFRAGFRNKQRKKCVGLAREIDVYRSRNFFTMWLTNCHLKKTCFELSFICI